MARLTDEITIPPAWLDAGPVVIEDGGYSMDGGSIWLGLRDAQGDEHEVVLVQHMIPNREGRYVPGRIYIDDLLVPVRSATEEQILAAIGTATIQLAYEDNGADEPLVVSENVLILGDDIKEYFAAVDEGPEASVRLLIARFLGYVETDEYVTFTRRYPA